MTAPEVVPCGHCGRPLTDPDSRALGYGPVCAAGVLGLDTHRTPVPRPRRRKDVDQLSLDSLTVLKGPTDVIQIFGESDDAIMVGGAIKAEFPCIDTGEDGVLLVASNGVILRIRYHTCWRIQPVANPHLDISIVPCPEDDDDNYSDVATIPGDVRWVVCRDVFVTV